MPKTYLEASYRQTQKLGQNFAKSLLKSGPKSQAVVLGLTGDLGGGKTTFLQGLAKGLGLKGRVLSPTFIIMRRMGHFYHLDCYRLKGPKDLQVLGFGKIISDPKNIVAVEWADKVKGAMPKSTVWLNFYFVDKNKRRIVVRSRHGR